MEYCQSGIKAISFNAAYPTRAMHVKFLGGSIQFVEVVDGNTYT